MSLVSPQPLQKRPVQGWVKEEIKLEQWAVNRASCIVHKLYNVASAGWPDRLFAWPPPRGHEYVEFKAEGERLRKLQKYRGEQLARSGHKVFTIDNKQDAKRYLDGELEPTFLPKTSD